jgi:SAM-dependent methyltransferase
MQHWMWKAQLGWDLHPAIKLPEAGDARIADQGCGNAYVLSPDSLERHRLTQSMSAWLVSLALDMEKEQRHASLIGLDVQDAHYPSPDNLPDNVTLGLLDAFNEDLPAEHIGVYDVVHVRAFASVVKEDNPGPILRNAYKMLKPGGYIQWDDLDGGSFKAVAPGSDPQSSTVPTTATEDLVATSLQSQSVALNLKYSWLQRLGSLFEEQGFELIDQKRMDVKKELRSVMTVSLLMIHAHIARIAVRNGCMVGTDKNWEEVWTKAGEEIGNGVSLTMDMVVVVGRKCA